MSEISEIKLPPGYYSLIQCHQCGGTGKDSKAEEAAPCCSCYGLGKIFINENFRPVDYMTQRNLVQKMRENERQKKFNESNPNPPTSSPSTFQQK